MKIPKLKKINKSKHVVKRVNSLCERTLKSKIINKTRYCITNFEKEDYLGIE